MTKKNNVTDSVKRLVLCGVFAALAYACVCVFRIKVPPFLTLDVKDAVITTAAMLIHPVAGIAISFIVALIEMLTLSDTWLYGFIMNFLSSATLSFVASIIYRQKKTLLGAILGLLSAVASVVTVMMLANLLITPLYMKMDVKAVIEYIPKLLLPFNLTKGVTNAALVMLIYKPISTALARAKLIKKSEGSSDGKYKFGLKTILVIVLSALIVAACMLILFLVFNASIIGWEETFLKYLSIFGLSMVPLIELRGAIPLGAGMGIEWYWTLLLSIIGNCLPIPVILLFVKSVLEWMRGCNVKFFVKLSNWLYSKAEKNKKKVDKYGVWGLFVFVALPLPGTGAWTGALVASLFDMDKKRAILSIVGGVICAGVLVTLIVNGTLGFLSFLI